MTSCLQCSEDMEPSELQRQILSSNKNASEKAEDLLLEREVNEMSKDEWRELIAGIPADVKREVGRLKAAGTQLHLLTCLASLASSALWRLPASFSSRFSKPRLICCQLRCTHKHVNTLRAMLAMLHLGLSSIGWSFMSVALGFALYFLCMPISPVLTLSVRAFVKHGKVCDG